MPRAKATSPALNQAETACGTMRLEHAGKWLAWMEDESRIVAVGDTVEEVRVAAERAGHSRVIYDWVPPADKQKRPARLDAKANRRKVQPVPREYAGKWVAWSADGRRIVAVGDTYKACEQAAASAGHSANQVAIDRVPQSRQRLTGSGL